MNQRFRILIAGMLTIAAAAATDAQVQHTPSRERVDASLRRRTEIDGNNVRTSVFNFAFSGRTGAGQGIPYEWPKNTGRYYVALVGLFIGGEVLDDTGKVVRIVDLPAYRQNPSTGGDWNLNPVPGYFNVETGKIAKSDEPASWPASWPDKRNDPVDPGWPGKWNGYFGKNQFSADQEMYYRVGDDNYTRYLYTPDTTDPTRRGLGMIVDVRVLEWSQVSVADAVFFIQAVKNDGTKKINKTAVTLWLADFVGGDGDSNDDKPDFDLIRDIAFSFDADGVSNNPAFKGVFVGGAATLYLETPGNAVDRIDNDGDGETGSPPITGAMLLGAGSYPPEVTGNQIDDNHNGLIDEDSTYIPFGTQRGVGYADYIDNDGNGEPGSPIVTQDMIDVANGDPWKRWPAYPESDAMQQGQIHLIGVGVEDLGRAYRDNIDNDGNAVGNWPTVTQAMIDQAAADPYHRYRVPGTKIILFDVGPEDLGKKYLNVDGARDVGIDEGIDEMVDESRNDGIDNDGDWNPLTDDVGLDGAPGTGDTGEGDGRPTSGVGTDYPGEPNIDKTDVSEADQIGLTNVQYVAAGAINFNTTPDVYFWAEFMLPGSFVNPAAIPVGESDLFVSCGVFPMEPGQIERISYAVVFGNAVRAGDANTSGAKDDCLRKREFAQLAYNEDYQFAQAPIEPKLTAIAGDRKVTLYWDDAAEKSVDRFIAGLPVPNALEIAKDFEGYRIYRSTDPAFEDARLITDAYGSPAPFLKPVAQFDLKDSVKGFHPIAYNGVQFDQGTNTGLVHAWTDTSVQNGQKYYYAIRAYDKGYTPLNITVAESNLRISLDDVTGKVKDYGTSVAIATPEAPAAGYTAPSLTKVTRVQGGTTGTIDYTIVDPYRIKNDHTYRVTFEDTVLAGVSPAPDTFKTTTYTLADITDTTSIDTLIDRSRAVSDTVEQPLIDGFRLTLRNEKLFGVNPDLTHWNNLGIWPFDFKQWRSGFTAGLQKPSDYRVVFGPLGIDTSTAFVVRENTPPRPAIPVNFKVYNIGENKEIEFAFLELDTNGGPGTFSARQAGFNRISDVIVFLERNAQDSLVITWSFSALFDSTLRRPEPGDTATIVLSKLFRREDVFEFTTTAQHVNQEKAASATSLDAIRVVPNPYIAAATWEERNPYTSGRGPREIHFTHLPQLCTIRIYTVDGELVTTLEHDKPMTDGTEPWNLLTRDNLTVSYGIYIYHIDAPGIGEKIGKFAIIK